MSVFLNEEKGVHVSQKKYFLLIENVCFRFMLFKNMKKQHFYNYLMEH
jgi:hypothetical protein